MRQSRSGPRVAVAGVVAMAACADVAPGTPSGSDGVATITSAGGRVAASSGAAVTIPPGALAGSARITVRAGGAATGLPEGVASAGPVVEFGPEGQRFAVAVTITLPTTATPDAVYTRPTGQGSWSRVEGARFDAERRVVLVPVMHFSEYVPGAATARDAGLPDAGLPDAGLPDGGLSDAGLPDAGLPDAGLPDGGLPDAGAPDVVEPRDAPPVCAAPRVPCGSGCVDLATDVAHCGTCGGACMPGATCRAGRCRATCAAPQVSCGAGCVDVRTDAAHCGRCGAACPDGRRCVDGVCAR